MKQKIFHHYLTTEAVFCKNVVFSPLGLKLIELWSGYGEENNLNRRRKAREEENCFACGANAMVLNSKDSRWYDVLAAPALALFATSVQTLHFGFSYAG
jgi:hypothetical protein